MEHIELSLNLLRTGLTREHTFTKVPPTKEGFYLIGANSCQELDVVELLNFCHPSLNRTRLGFKDYDGEIAYIDKCPDIDWLVYAE